MQKTASLSLGLLVAFASLVVVGCGPSGPTTFPLTGKVVDASGKPIPGLAGCTVEFQSATDHLIHGYGEIKEDGSFTMATQTQGVGKEGVVEGTHQVRIMLNIEQDEDKPIAGPTIIPLKYTKFETSGITCEVPKDKELVIKITP
jgi:hypothetical protein